MEINKKIMILITIMTFVLVALMDLINITKYVSYSEHLDSTIANTITFISILIGFISSIYVMLQQDQNTCVMKLLRSLNLLKVFNNSFKVLVYIGFFDVIILILMNLVASNSTIFKIIVYFAIPVTVYFLLSSMNIIITICKMISAEEKLKQRNNRIEKDDIIID